MGTAEGRCAAALLAASTFFSAAAQSSPNGPAPRRDDPGEEHPATIVALDWKRGAGTEGCIDAAALEREVEGRLERRVFGNAMEADVFLRGQIERRAGDFEARLSMVAANGRVLGERELHTEALDCRRLDESLAVVIALALDSLRAIPAASLRVPTSAPRPGWSAKVGPTVVGSWGLLPTAAVSVGFDVAVQPPSLWPIDFAWSLSPASTRVDWSGRGANFSAMQLGLYVCPLAHGSGIELSGCLGAELDYLTATGFALDIERSAQSLVFGPALRTSVFFPFGHAAGFTTNFNLAVPLLRDRFTYTTEQGTVVVLHRPEPVMLFLGIGILVRIP
jgi:hypothetical protein